MRLSPDEMIFWQQGMFSLNLTIVGTWAVMLLLVLISAIVTRRLRTDRHISRWQNILEMVVLGINGQIKDVGLKNARAYLPFIGTLFLFIVTANLLTVLPRYEPPTGSLSTTTALALCVFVAVPFYGIGRSGLVGYLRSYLRPTFFMLPFNLIGEVSRTLALAVRLFGNMMSGGIIIAILLGIAPFFFPAIMKLLGLLTGVVQAYIFSILAAVYIAAAVEQTERKNKIEQNNNLKSESNG